jgi:hypothetical protein
MSIIAEALKKAQETSKAHKQPVPIVEKKFARPAKKKLHPLIALISGLLLVISLLGVAFYFTPAGPLGMQPTVEPTREEIAPAASPADASDKTQNKPKPQPAENEEKGEPALPPTPTPPTLPAFSRESIDVNGIMYSPGKPLAIINDNIAAEGDTVGNVKILKIGKDFVRFDADGEEFEIKLKR